MAFGGRRGILPGGRLTRMLVMIMIVGFFLSGGYRLVAPALKALFGVGAEAGRVVQDEVGVSPAGGADLPSFGGSGRGGDLDSAIRGDGAGGSGLVAAVSLPPLLVAVEGDVALEPVLAAMAAVGARPVASVPVTGGGEPDLVVTSSGTPGMTAAPAAGGPARLVVRGDPADRRLQLLQQTAPLLSAPAAIPVGRTGPAACAGLTVAVDASVPGGPEPILGALAALGGGRGVVASLGGEALLDVKAAWGAPGIATDGGGRLDLELGRGLTAGAARVEVQRLAAPMMLGGCAPVSAAVAPVIEGEQAADGQPVIPAEDAIAAGKARVEAAEAAGETSGSSGKADPSAQARQSRELKARASLLGPVLLVAAVLGVVAWVAAPVIRRRRAATTDTTTAGGAGAPPTGDPDDLDDDADDVPAADPDDLADDDADVPAGAGG